MEGEFRFFVTFRFQQTLLMESIQHFQDVQHFKCIRPPDQVRAFPAQRGVSMAAFGADHGFYLQLLRTVDDALHQHPGDVGNADLDAAVGRLERFGTQRPCLVRLFHDARDRAEVLREIDDLHRRHQ